MLIACKFIKKLKLLSARPEKIFNITHYLYGNISVKHNFSAGEWLKKVKLNLKKIINKKKTPIFIWWDRFIF